jgi:hypothetical protein
MRLDDAAGDMRQTLMAGPFLAAVGVGAWGVALTAHRKVRRCRLTPSNPS